MSLKTETTSMSLKTPSLPLFHSLTETSTFAVLPPLGVVNYSRNYSLHVPGVHSRQGWRTVSALISAPGLDCELCDVASS